MARLLLGPALLVLERDFRPLSQPPNRFRKIDAFVFFDEGEYVPAFMTAEAMENLALRIDVEAGRFLFVKRAQSDKVRPGALEWNIRPNDIHNVTGSANLFF